MPWRPSETSSLIPEWLLGLHGIPGTRPIDLVLEPGLWILPPPGIYRPYPRLGRRIEMPQTAFLVAIQSQCWIGCHRQGLLLPPHSGREPGQTSPTTPDSDSDGSVRPHPDALIACLLEPFCRGQSCPATVKSQRTRRSLCSTDQSRDDDLRSLRRSPKRSRTASASAPRRSRQPFTVFPSKRDTRPSLSPLTSCKHYCHAFLRHGRKCLSPCARRRPGHYHCRCVRHQRR